MLDDKGLEARKLPEDLLAAAVELEQTSLPPGEADLPEHLQFRHANAGEFYLMGILKSGSHAGEMVGAISGTRWSELSSESLYSHDPDGPTLCIHSGGLAKKHRRKGYATVLLKAYLDHVALTQPGVRRVCLLSKAGLLGMHATCGLVVKGLSPLVFGKDPWYEMNVDLDASEPRLQRFIQVRELPEAHLAAAVEMEQTSFPSDEADTPEDMHFRHANAEAFFLEGVRKNGGTCAGEMVGMVCSSRCQGLGVSHEPMHSHDPNGSTLCIHSVLVVEKHRGRGYATVLLKAYLDNVALSQPGVRRVCLMSKAGLLGMYASCGFAVKGLSQVVLGKDPWFEMTVDLDATEQRLRKFMQVDAFSDRKFGGNPAAVFFTQAGGDAGWKVAIEMHLSATCFLELRPDSLGKDSEGPMYALRWFTPGGEVDLCGHASLAAAFALWGESMVDPATTIRFSTASGVLTCRRDVEGWVEMDLPAAIVGDPLPSTDGSRREIEEALRISLFVNRNRDDIIVEITPQSFDALDPDMSMLAAIDIRGFIVTCEVEGGDGGVDYRTRLFAPTMRIDEDPVTGSAHCCLVPYWASKLGRDSLKGYQASPRGGTIHATVCRGEKRGRLLLKGKAVTVSRGLFRR